MQIAVGIDDHAVRTDDRFDEQRGDAVAAFVNDDVFQMRERPLDFNFRIARVERAAVRKRCEETHDARNAGFVVPPRDGARHLDRVFVRFAAAGREEDAAAPFPRRELHDRFGEFRAAIVGHARRSERQPACLLADRLRERGMPVAQVDGH